MLFGSVEVGWYCLDLNECCAFLLKLEDTILGKQRSNDGVMGGWNCDTQFHPGLLRSWGSCFLLIL